MAAPIAWKRALLAAGIFAGAVVGVAGFDRDQHVGPLTISGVFKGRSVMVTATGRSAGAIESLQWGGVEFINASDNGRHLQSAVSFDGLTECDNPTEAGASIDGWAPTTSSSRLEQGSSAGNVLRTRSQMAYWLRLGQQRSCGVAQNKTALSSTYLVKSVRFLPGFSNVLEHSIAFDLARPRKLAQFEVLTAYMPESFDTFYRFNPSTGRMEPLSDGPGEQELPVALATSDGEYALALFTPQRVGPGLAGPGYGRWRFTSERVTKSNVVFRQTDADAGAHRFLVYSVFGTLGDVRSTLIALHERGVILTQRALEPAGADPLAALAKN